MIHILLNVSLVKDQHRQPLYFIVQIQDISDRYKVDPMKNEFISIVSHELRTPLTAIRGSLGILETGIFDHEPEQAKEMLQIAFNNSDRLVRLVNDILDLERLESGKTQLVMETCEIADLVQQAIETVQAIAKEAREEGLLKAKTEQPLDAILLDVSMPDMDGFQVYARLRSDVATQSIPVILLTAKVLPSDRQAFQPNETAQTNY
ncbi:ATP-binding response regulator [Fischerella thermalis]|uniref:ATP-binding response regulator n=1 Tax=Fischerella thermalis TaxID=372787 RepID=UPI002154F86F|nr:histidine kinase dimerization/phospho-acceptor domain-containing protein [Fischerella thermalis]